jgi:hypothetical protein
LPDHLWVGDIGRTQIRALPDELRKAARLLIMTLLDAPVPPEASEYEGVADAYRISAFNITVYYSVIGEDVMIWQVEADS